MGTSTTALCRGSDWFFFYIYFICTAGNDWGGGNRGIEPSPHYTFMICSHDYGIVLKIDRVNSDEHGTKAGMLGYVPSIQLHWTELNKKCVKYDLKL